MSSLTKEAPRIVVDPMVVRPPSHPTYDLKAVIRLALSEDAGDRGVFLFFAPLFPVKFRFL